jgi:hypothetical protein
MIFLILYLSEQREITGSSRDMFKVYRIEKMHKRKVYVKWKMNVTIPHVIKWFYKG